jgi:hypothetical protein
MIKISHVFPALFLFLMTTLAACGLFDSRTEWQGGPYILSWIDEPSRVELSHESSGGIVEERIAATVYAMGWDGQYLVAKQHPKGNKVETNYFVIDATKDTSGALVQSVVLGPLTEVEFQQKSAALKLPKFSKILASLE